jgi:ferredoxin-NADP reductase
MTDSATAPLQARVHALHTEAEGVCSLDLRAVDGRALPPFTPGAHVDLHLPGGLVRSYSLCNPQHETHRYQVAVQRDPASRGGSRWVHSALSAGDTLRISAPRNHFKLDEAAPAAVLVAGGIGITPLWCMAQRLLAIGQPAVLVYAARSRRHAAFLDAITAAAASSPTGLQLVWHADDEHGGPPDLAALMQSAAGRLPAAAHWYACGPAPMLAAYEKACAALPPEQVHLERFAAPPTPTTSDATRDATRDATGERIEPAAPGTPQPQLVYCQRSDKAVTVAPGQSILDALLDAGLEVEHSCQEGVCGSCEMGVLEGAIEHRDHVLSPRERAAGRTMMVCVSRAAGASLVLDC